MQIATLIIKQVQRLVKITRKFRFNSIQKTQPVRRKPICIIYQACWITMMTSWAASEVQERADPVAHLGCGWTLTQFASMLWEQLWSRGGWIEETRWLSPQGKSQLQLKICLQISQSHYCTTAWELQHLKAWRHEHNETGYIQNVWKYILFLLVAFSHLLLLAAFRDGINPSVICGFVIYLLNSSFGWR